MSALRAYYALRTTKSEKDEENQVLFEDSRQNSTLFSSSWCSERCLRALEPLSRKARFKLPREGVSGLLLDAAAAAYHRDSGLLIFHAFAPVVDTIFDDV